MQEKDIRLLMEITPERESLVGLMQGVKLQRTKTVKAGTLLYCSSYPIWNTLQAMAAKKQLENKRRQKGTSAAQERLNARKAQQKLETIINANFGPGDLLVTCTYPDGASPSDEASARKDMRNYLARLKRLCARRGSPAPAYVYVTEETNTKRWGVRYHHHMILKADITREEAERCWYQSCKGICNTRSAQKLKEGLTGWAKYISKQVCSAEAGKGHPEKPEKKRRRWCASKGLKVPEPSVADKKISPRRVEKIARDITSDPGEAKRQLEKCYPGYEALEIQVRTSAWVTGAYIYAVLSRKEENQAKKKAKEEDHEKRTHGLDRTGIRLPDSH